MRLRNIPYADEVISKSSYVISDPFEKKGKIASEVFSNDHPIHIEIGMGKGQFIIEKAKQNPEINYIGIELYSSVLVRAIQKMDKLEEEGQKITNLRFLCIDAKKLNEIFQEEEVDKIYLNFSDPWPKDRHAKRRLPSRQFLALYDQFLKKDGKLEFKTDNRGLFDFAVEELPFAGWKADCITYDLHHDEILNQGNIMTEYEEKFSSQGNPICKYIICREK